MTSFDASSSLLSNVTPLITRIHNSNDDVDHDTRQTYDYVVGWHSGEGGGGGTGTGDDGEDSFHLLYTAVNRITLPTLGVLGTLGNLANIVIFARRYRKRKVNATERGAVLGFVALAVSDLCFCLGLVPRFGLPSAPSVVYEQRADFALLYQMYGLYVHDLFIKVSTWLATVISVSRYANVARPSLVPTKGSSLRRLKVAIVAVYVIWPLLLLPRLWTFDIAQLTRSPSINDTVLPTVSGSIKSIGSIGSIGRITGESVGGSAGSAEILTGSIKSKQSIRGSTGSIHGILGSIKPIESIRGSLGSIDALAESAGSTQSIESSMGGETMQPETVMYVLHLGAFKLNKHMKLTFTYVWVLLGYFLPIAILVYCNARLVIILRNNRAFWEQDCGSDIPTGHHDMRLTTLAQPRRSSRAEQQHLQHLQQQGQSQLKAAGVGGGGGGKASHRYWGLSVSALLVLLVSMFLILVSPSELLHFYDDLVQPATFRAYEAAILATNVLQATNFAVHFVLYCVFSRPYRRAVYSCLLVIRSRLARASMTLTRTICCRPLPSDYELQPTSSWPPRTTTRAYSHRPYNNPAYFNSQPHRPPGSPQQQQPQQQPQVWPQISPQRMIPPRVRFAATRK